MRQEGEDGLDAVRTALAYVRRIYGEAASVRA
jgi:hypothetical protein